nr:autotransporter-associated beta strand repeat-containing protein [Akkermansiaceae bacterium]
LNDFNQTIGSLAGGGAAGGSVNLGTATLTTGGRNATTNYAGVIGGTGGLTKTGTGVQYLSGSNTFSGPTSVNAGYLVLQNNSALGGSTATVASGATLQLENNINLAGNAVTISGTGVGGTRGALASWSGDNTWGGSVTLAADSSFFVASGNFTISGAIGGGYAVTKTGNGALILSGANDYTGGTTAGAGTLALGASNVLPDTTNVTLGGATLAASSFTDTVGTLEVTGTATISLDSGGAMVFADSSAVAWTGTLNITGTFVPGASIRFGTTSGGLTSHRPRFLALRNLGGPGRGLRWRRQQRRCEKRSRLDLRRARQGRQRARPPAHRRQLRSRLPHLQLPPEG